MAVLPTSILNIIRRERSLEADRRMMDRVSGRMFRAVAPGYVWERTIIYRCPVCQSTSEYPEAGRKKLERDGEESRPTCHNNRYHGKMDKYLEGKIQVLHKWVD